MNWLWGRKQVCDFQRRVRKLLLGIIKKDFKKIKMCLLDLVGYRSLLVLFCAIYRWKYELQCSWCFKDTSFLMYLYLIV